jgi:hypothetical protein
MENQVSEKYIITELLHFQQYADARMCEFVGILTRYMECGSYDGFFREKGHFLTEKNLMEKILPYKIYTLDDIKNCPITSE